MSRIRRTLTLSVTASFIAAATTGCSLLAPNSAPVASVLPTRSTADPSVDYNKPAHVCEALAATVHRVDTVVDQGPQDAYRRATAYMDPQLAKAIAVTHAVPETVQWQQWRAHRAYVDVRLDPYAGDALPEPNAGEQHHAVLVTVWPIGRDSWRGPAQRRTVVCALRAAVTGWRVSGYEIG